MASTSIVSCEDECDVCFCESTPEREIEAIEKCQAIGDECCKDPYGEFGYFIARYLPYSCSPLLAIYLTHFHLSVDSLGWWDNDPEMGSLEYLRECTEKPCGTCRGNCKTNDDCNNVALCSKDPNNLKDIYDIPGCKGDPALVNVPGGKPLEVGYCYHPNAKSRYPDRTTLTNSCLAETTTNGYGQCCGLPRFASQCGQTFNNYCDRQTDIPIIGEPGMPGTGTEQGTPTPVFELARYTGSFCGTTIEDICSPCPSVDKDDGCPTVNCPTGDLCITVSDLTCPGCFVQTGTTSFERSGEESP